MVDSDEEDDDSVAYVVRIGVAAGQGSVPKSVVSQVENAIEAAGFGEVAGSFSMGGAEIVLFVDVEDIDEADLPEHVATVSAWAAQQGFACPVTVEVGEEDDEDDEDDADEDDADDDDDDDDDDNDDKKDDGWFDMGEPSEAPKVGVAPAFEPAGLDPMAVYVAGRNVNGPESDEKPLYGLIRRSGEWALPAEFSVLQPMSDDIFLACRRDVDDGLPIYINAAGQRLFTLDNQEEFGSLQTESMFQDGWAVVRLTGVGDARRESGTYTFVDGQGALMGRPRYQNALPFSDGLAAVEVAERWGFIDAEGKIAIEPRFEEVFGFADGLAMATTDGEYCGFIDGHGKWIIKPRFYLVRGFSDGVSAAEYQGQNGYIDRSGKWTIKPTFTDAGDFKEGLARVSDGTKSGFINPQGQLVVPYRFHDVGDFHHGVAAVAEASTGDEYKPETWGLIDRTGAWVLSPAFDSLAGDNGMFRATVSVDNATRHSLLTPDGKIVCQWLVPSIHDILPNPIPPPDPLCP